MPHSVAGMSKAVTAWPSLVVAARILGLALDTGRLSHEAALGSNTEPDALTLVRIAKRCRLRARIVSADWARLERVSLPVLARQADGAYVVLLKRASDGRLLVYDPREQKPLVLPREVFEPSWSGALVLIQRGILSAASGHFDISWFVPAIWKYRSLFAEVLVASLCVQIFGLVSPLFFQVVVDKVLVHHGTSTLDVLIAGLVLLGVFEVIITGLRSYVFSHTTQRVDVELGAALYKHLLRLPLAWFRARRVGDSVARVRELDTLRQFLTGSALTLALDLVFTVVFLAVMAVYSVPLTLIVLATLPVYALLASVCTPPMRARLNDKFARGAENQAFLVETVSGIETLKSLAVEPQLQRHWESGLAAYVRASFRAGVLGTIAAQGVQLVHKLGSAALLWAGAHQVMDGTLTVGELVAFNMLAGQVAAPVLRLVQLAQEFPQAALAVARLGDILNSPAETDETPRAQPPRLRGAIRFEQVRFRYRPEQAPVLDGFSLELRAGEVVGLVGASGSGKSTLTKLIQRLYVPEAGRVLLDGQDLALIDPVWLRRHIGVVLQENWLLNRSVRENIALADPGLALDRVMHAAQLAGAHGFISELPEGYDTPVGEHGAALSGGQRQRLALARALVTDPRLLILDEATSALDYESEAVIRNNLGAICAGRTVLIIAHRLSTVRKADRILVMERGRLVEQGTHTELLARGGRYARLHALQDGLANVGGSP